MTMSRAEVLDWVQDRLGRELAPDAQADLLRETGREGAAEALIADFAVRFEVDMTGYQPQMHTRRANQLLRPDWPFPAPPPHGVAVPLSVSLLHRAAVAKRWPVRYPVLPVARDLSLANVPLLMTGLIAATLLVLWAVPRLF